MAADEVCERDVVDILKKAYKASGALKSVLPNQKNIYGAALALIAIMYGIMQGIIAVASLLATMALYWKWQGSTASDVCLGFITCTTLTTAV